MNKKLTTLQDLLILKIKALYDIETQLTKALPKMEEAATDEGLKEVFSSHLEETEGHIERLEKIFMILGERPQKTKVGAIRGLIEDGKWIIESQGTAEVKDALLIAAAQYVEHYEMAGYGSAKEWARLLGEDEIGDLLEEILEEEKMADEKLNLLAEEGINEKAIKYE